MTLKSAGFAKSRVHFKDELPPASRFGANAVLIYDRVLSRQHRRWIASFPFSYGVRAGESLKDLSGFAMHVERVSRLVESASVRDLTFVVAGGGSVGDFGGFLASVFKRGVGLVQLPSTWLSAIDSAHGGKTALNVGAAKNQIGTFYPASEIYVCRSLLQGQPTARLREAFGELAKIALLDRALWLRLTSGPRRQQLLTEDEFWKFLPLAIAAKTAIVRRDPREQSGMRQILNLGHTWGHVIESMQGLAHGTAVGQGLIFALSWSFERGALGLQDFGAIRFALSERFGLSAEPPRRRLARKKAAALLARDKKARGAGNVTFVFLKGLGRPAREKVSVESVLAQASEQGWV